MESFLDVIPSAPPWVIMQKDRVESNTLRHVAYEEMLKGTGKQVEAVGQRKASGSWVDA